MKGDLLMKLFASLTGFLGKFIAKTTSGACYWSLWDEEEMPKSLLK